MVSIGIDIDDDAVGPADRPNSVPYGGGIPACTVAQTIPVPFNNADALDARLAELSGQVACVIMEPGMMNIGVVLPQDGYLAAVREITQKHGVLLILDEVMTGFRVDAGGAQALYGVTPDLSCFGKVIGGGLPVGAYGGRGDLMDRVSPSGPIYQAGTLSGNPLAMTAGLWALDRLTPALYRKLAALGRALASGLADAAREAGVAIQVNALGSMITPFFTSTRVRDFQSAVTSDTAAFGAFFRGMLDRGIYLPPSQFEAWFISGAHTPRDIQRTVVAARAAMLEVRRHKQ